MQNASMFTQGVGPWNPAKGSFIGKAAEQARHRCSSPPPAAAHDGDSSPRMPVAEAEGLAARPDRRLKIAMLAAHTLQDRKRSSWGGTVDQMAQALQRHCGDVYLLNPVPTKRRLVGKALHKLSRPLLKKNYLYNHTFSLARGYARTVAPWLAGQSFDVIVAPSGGTEIAFLETDIPRVLVEDANFALLHNYYPEYSNLLRWSAYQVDALEKAAIGRASLVLHPSERAARATIERYGVDERKVRVIPFGANLETPPPAEAVLARQKSGSCRLLFLGVDWERKGGEIAFQALLQLEEMGVRAELIVCGCLPPARFTHERMVVIPFLKKSDPKQREELERLFYTSDFLFLPTRGECYGMVFCEASAFGLPVITTDTGGVPGAVRQGENGFMLPPTAVGADYAELIARLYRDDRLYAELVRSSRAAFDERLNWNAWALAVRQALVDVLGRETPAARSRYDFTSHPSQ